MSRLIFAAVSILTAALGAAQTKEPDDSWLMQNYRFAQPPAPGEIRPVGPAVGQLQDVQNTVLNILRKANFDGDFEAALIAAAQAVANAQILGTMSGELKPPQPAPPRGAAMDVPAQPEPLYLIAFTDQTIQAATAVWRDNLMLHYITRGGAHEQVRLDRVDWKLSAELLEARTGRRVRGALPGIDTSGGRARTGWSPAAETGAGAR